MNFEYSYVRTAMGDIEIDDIGNVSLIANTDNDDEFYLYIHTSLGQTTIIQYGPINPDFDTLPNFVSCTYQQVTYNDKFLKNTIRNFINNSKYHITQVQVVDAKELAEKTKDLTRYIL